MVYKIKEYLKLINNKILIKINNQISIKIIKLYMIKKSNYKKKII